MLLSCGATLMAYPCGDVHSGENKKIWRRLILFTLSWIYLLHLSELRSHLKTFGQIANFMGPKIAHGNIRIGGLMPTRKGRNYWGLSTSLFSLSRAAWTFTNNRCYAMRSIWGILGLWSRNVRRGPISRSRESNIMELLLQCLRSEIGYWAAPNMDDLVYTIKN